MDKKLCRKAIYDQTRGDLDELTFKKGDIISHVRDTDETVWGYGMLDGEGGRFIKNNVIDSFCPGDANFLEDGDGLKKTPPKKKPKPKPKRWRWLYPKQP